LVDHVGASDRALQFIDCVMLPNVFSGDPPDVHRIPLARQFTAGDVPPMGNLAG
jgi:hypothetical protein